MVYLCTLYDNLTSVSDYCSFNMVSSWLPEPPNGSPGDEIEATDDITLPGSDTSDTEDDEFAYEGYEPLPLGPQDMDNEPSSEDEEINATNTNTPPSSSQLPTIVPIERTLVREVWSSPAPKCVDIDMDPVKANEVKMVMANVTLPSSSIPDWAAVIPEDQWKEQLINRIQNLQ